VWKETGKRRRWWKAHELFADRRCSQAVLNFLASTEVGKTVPAADEDARSEASEWELRERAEREEERRAEAETLGRGMEREEHPLFLPTPPSWHWRERSRVFCCFCFSFVHFFGRAGRRAQGELALCRPARFAARKRIVNSPLVMIYIGRIRVMIKKKKKKKHYRRWTVSPSTMPRIEQRFQDHPQGLKQTISELKIKPHNINNCIMDENGFFLGFTQRSVRVLVKGSEKAAFLWQPGQQEMITVFGAVGAFEQEILFIFHVHRILWIRSGCNLTPLYSDWMHSLSLPM